MLEPEGGDFNGFGGHPPALIEDVFALEVTDLLPGSAYSFMTDVVCGAVILLMLYKSLLIPRLHRCHQWKGG